jgi:dTDP-4-amino-4,6-dideoxy-D-galactose acyltransferase
VPDAEAGVPGEPPGELLSWDSEHFGRRIGRVRGRRLTPDAVGRIGDWAAREGVECLYFLADAADAATAPLAEASGFRLVDVRVTLERRAGRRTRPGGSGVIDPPGTIGAMDEAPVHGSSFPGAIEVRAAVAGDLAALRRIAATSHHDSRFFQDPHFDRNRAADLYAIWIEKCCADPAGIVLVAAPAVVQPALAAPAVVAPTVAAPTIFAPGVAARVEPGLAAGVQGYITAAVTSGGGGQIGLFAVADAARGQGVGGRLIAAALAWLAARGADPVTVVTQGRNIRAQRIYQRFGLLSHDLELWFHRWRLHDDAAGAHAGWRPPRP